MANCVHSVSVHILHYEKFPDGSVKYIEDEIPFELPEGWEWTRLGVVFYHNTGKALNKSKTEGKMLTYITTSNLYWNRFEIDKLKSMPFTDSEVEKCTVRKGDLLVCEGGDIGRAAIWNYDDEIRIQNHIHRLRAYIKLNIEFYYHVFYLYKLTDMISGKGIGIQGLSSNQLHSIPIPLPPIQEQHRIVAKLNDLISFVEFIDSDKTDLLTTIQLTKSKILDLAIRGKLVPQDPNDEQASALLERIRAEKEELIKQGKIKRDKKESVIYKGDDNYYYGDFETSDNNSVPTSTSSKKTTTAKTTPDIIYQVYTDTSGWLPTVKNLEDYAGVDGQAIKGLRVFANSVQLDVVIHQMSNGSIDKLTISTPDHTIKYRVRTIGSADYFSWMENEKDTGSSTDTFAGEEGKPIDRVQITMKQ